MSGNFAKRTAFTLIEFLIALVIIGFIVAILVGVFSSPLKQAKTDAAVNQVKDGMRQWNDAVHMRMLRTGSDMADEPDKYVEQGYLTAMPALPEWVNSDGQPLNWEYDESWPVGGCESGVTQMENMLYLYSVTAEFCMAYNKAQGLGDNFIGKNCADASTPCVEDTTDWHPAPVAAATFCYQRADSADHFIIMPTGIKKGICP